MYSTENWHSIYQSIAVAYFFSGLIYCALLHSTRVCKRNEYYFGGSRELMFSCSYEATVTKTHFLRRFSLFPREKILFYSLGRILVGSAAWYLQIAATPWLVCRGRKYSDKLVWIFLEKGSFDSISHIYQDSAKFIFVCSLLQFTALAFRHRARDNCSQLCQDTLFHK